MREALAKELVKQAKKNKNLILLTGDLGYTVFEEFQRLFPNQFFNVGVAESNMIGIATGLALSGKTVFCYSIANFVTLRTLEQVRNDVCVHNAHVVIVGTGAGLSYSNAGPTHHAVEDIALMRTIPNLNIFSPADALEVEWTVKTSIKIKKPVYIRLGKKGEPLIHTKTPKLTFGKGNIIKNGKDLAIISTGNLVYNSIEAEKILNKIGISATVANFNTLKPIDEKLILSLAKKHKILFTVEEHVLSGGLGSIVSEVLAPYSENNIYSLGIPNVFTFVSGSQTYLREKYGLTPEKIAKSIKKVIKK